MTFSHRFCCRWQVMALVTLVFVAAPARGAEKDKEPKGAKTAGQKVGASVDIVPGDASFYSSSLRWGEQLETIRQSKAWKRIQELPAVQMGWQLLDAQMSQPNSPLDTIQQLLQLPENQQLLEVVVDSLSSEVFVYGDASFTNFVKALLDGYNTAQATNMGTAIKQAMDLATLPAADLRRSQADSNRDGARAFLLSLQAHLEDLNIPGVVMGFKIKNAEPVQTQLKRLEVIAKMGLKQAPPPLRNRLKRVKVDGNEYLTLQLDGGLVPWEQVPWHDFEDQAGEFKPLADKLKSLTLSLTLGVRGEYLLASIGSSSEHLARLGSSQTLVDRPEMKPLVELGGKRLTGIAYCNAGLRAALVTTKEDLQQIPANVANMLKQLDVDKSLRKRIAADAKTFVTDVTPYVPEVGAIMGFSKLTSRGFEGYVYDWNENLYLDGSQPLPLLDHLGGSPLAALVMRGKYDPQQWDLAVKWAQIGYGYFREYALPKMKEEEQKQFEKVAEQVLPLVARFSDVTRNAMLPALADGQSALVLDAKLTSRQWHKEMPPGPKPLPMLEPAVVMSVSDAKLLKKALSQYLEIANAVVDVIRNFDSKAIPADFRLPAPEQSSSKAGDNFVYRLPDELGIDPQIVLAGGLSADTWVVGSIATEQVQSLLAKQPFKLPKTLAADEGPMAGIAWFDFAGFVDAITPWVDYGVQVSNGMQPGDADDMDPQSQFILDQVHTGLDVLKVIRSYASVTRVEGKALVVHSEVHFQDVD